MCSENRFTRFHNMNTTEDMLVSFLIWGPYNHLYCFPRVQAPQETANSAEKKEAEEEGSTLSKGRWVGCSYVQLGVKTVMLACWAWGNRCTWWNSDKCPAFFRRVMNLISISLILKQPWGYGYHQVPNGPSTMGSFTPGKIHSWPVKKSIFLTKRHTQAIPHLLRWGSWADSKILVLVG